MSLIKVLAHLFGAFVVWFILFASGAPALATVMGGVVFFSLFLYE